MKIVCDNWEEDLDWFMDKETRETMKDLGLYISKINPMKKTVHVKGNDAELFARMIAEMSEEETKCKPDPELEAVKI